MAIWGAENLSIEQERARTTRYRGFSSFALSKAFPSVVV